MEKLSARTYQVSDDDFPVQILVEAKDLETFIGVVSPALIDQPMDPDFFERPLTLDEVPGNALARVFELPGSYPKPSDILVSLTLSYAVTKGADPRYEITARSAKGDADTSVTRAKRPGLTFELR